MILGLIALVHRVSLGHDSPWGLSLEGAARDDLIGLDVLLGRSVDDLLGQARRVAGLVPVGGEPVTPDSSRFWPGDTYEEGADQPSFDKQFVRDWLTANWDKTGNPPRLPQDIIDATSAKYIQAFETITGQKFDPATF